MIKHIKCDIFESGADYICHQVNCQGVMGSGIARQVREKCPIVYEQYKRWCDMMPKNELLGKAQFVKTQKEHHTSFKGIVNLFAQYDYGYAGKCYTDYDSMRNALEIFKSHLLGTSTIAIPYLMGCNRGGGDWNVVHKMIAEVFADYDGDVLICEYNGG